MNLSLNLLLEQAEVGPDVRTHKTNNISMYINRDDQPVFINQTIRNLSLPRSGVELVI
jgi:hypothetical protein